MCFGGGGKSEKAAKDAQKSQQRMYEQQRADAAAAEARAREEAARRAANIQTGMANIDRAFSGYNDEYFNKVGDEYSAYYNPQLQQQADQARERMLFNAARSGMVNSSQYGRNIADLDNNLSLRRNEIESQRMARMNEARSDIARQRSSQVAALNATQGDAAAASPFLSGQISVNNPNLPAFSPLGDLFGGLAGIVANDARVANAQGQEGLLQRGVNSMVGRQSGYVQ